MHGRPTMKSISARECSRVVDFQHVSNDQSCLSDICHIQPHIFLSLASFSSTGIFSSNLDISCLFPDEWNIESNELHPWSCNEAQNLLEPQDDPWTIYRTPSTSSRKHFTSHIFNLLRMWLIPTSVFWAVMTSSLIVGMRAMLVNIPCGITRILGSSRSQ
jgi:hypothetical protein